MEDLSKQMATLAIEFAQCKEAFTAMGDENRQLIILALMEHYGGLRVNEIAQYVHLSRPAVSHHLAVLKAAGIVDMYEVGTKNYYHMSPKQENWDRFTTLMKHVNAFMETIKKSGTPCCQRED